MKLSFLAPALLLHLGVHVRVGVFAQITTTTTSFTPSSVPLETRSTLCFPYPFSNGMDWNTGKIGS
jgi:hypothetical protein